uniref:Thyroglobulin type-1 domain-containing protein n=1 Tax=Steinernema glaseri TaxID=37863 RepID=A0A1I7ZIP8_9BILA
MSLLSVLVPLALLVASVQPSALIYSPAHFHKNDLCVKLRCGAEQLCLVKDDSAECIPKEQLAQVHRKHAANAGHLPHRHGKAPRQNPKHLATEHKHECGVPALHSMGFRMLEWAGAMFHAQGSPAPVNMPKHRAVCRAEVLWMFTQWDGDADGALSLRELYPLEADQREKCLKEFLDHCGKWRARARIPSRRCARRRSDKGDEWSRILKGAEIKLEKEPACHAEQHEKDPHDLGAFHPRCDLDGFYRPEQCHENECWCVDRYGREFDKSRVQGQLPDCGQYGSVSPHEGGEGLSPVGALTTPAPHPPLARHLHPIVIPHNKS